MKKSYPAEEIGHFRALVLITLRAVKHDILEILFSSSDKSGRFGRRISDTEKLNDPAGIAYGIGSGAWERHVKLLKPGSASDKEEAKSLSANAELIANVEDAREFVQVRKLPLNRSKSRPGDHCTLLA